LFNKLQYATDAENLLHMNRRTHGHVWSRTVATFQRSRDGCEWFDRRQKCLDEVFLHF